MTLDRWIAVVSSIAAMISAFLAACGIYQAIMQRRSMYRPQIIPQNFHFKGKCNLKNNFDSDILNRNTYNEYKINVINPGLGAAVNIEYKWIFNHQEYAQYLQQRLYKLNSTEAPVDPSRFLFNYHFEESDNDLIFYSRSTLRMNTHIINKKSELIQCFLPYSVEKTEAELKFQTLSLVFLMNDIMLNLKGQIDINKTKGPTLEIKYQDIGGKHIVELFETEVALVDSQTFNGLIEYVASFTFKKLNKSRTAAIRQRIRKSYADFINEHDYNKNK
ncbi:hypothetical protein INP82_06710 [Citrobacter sedlakii]|uniref:hypothetical protein n=1 Tax=Citrobacter TaxID=544 RepID=UPI001969C4F2|nr:MULTISPECIES: hypothetical protein [Citrobacter]MBM9567120.1 hypothetical protein [Citrobacter sedlakii]HBL4692615.1 hypothetical protein [Citrobacter sedlakii]HBL4707054.1 hypothetical protein [Citrobacter sedlakii]HBL4718464.1 hypothetical protein [Citrobacter sedlakii]HCA7839416.1 hypothetical protein [Citrobacter sedlakii]